MPLYTAGQRIRGNEINSLPQTYFCTTDQVASSTAFINAAGLAFTAEINSRYLVECFLFYRAGLGNDLKLQWTFPAGATGRWAADGIDSGAAGGAVGSVNRQSLLMQTPGVHAFNGDNGVDVFAKPALMFVTAGTSGTVQLQFAQLVAGGTTTIWAGSLLRVTKMA